MMKCLFGNRAAQEIEKILFGKRIDIVKCLVLFKLKTFNKNDEPSTTASNSLSGVMER